MKDSKELREMSIQNAKIAMEQSRGIGELTPQKREYLKELREWLETYSDNEEFLLDYGISRDTAFFEDLIRKVIIIGSYSVVDRTWLTMITKAHNQWKRNT
jgi:hypothetical protein